MPAFSCVANRSVFQPKRQDAASSALSEFSATREPQHFSRTQLSQVILAFAAVYLIWGLTFLGINIAIQSIPPGVKGGMRWRSAGVLFYAVLRWRTLISEQRAAMGVSDTCVRISVGLENERDLIADFRQALETDTN